MQVKFWVTEC